MIKKEKEKPSLKGGASKAKLNLVENDRTWEKGTRLLEE